MTPLLLFFFSMLESLTYLKVWFAVLHRVIAAQAVRAVRNGLCGWLGGQEELWHKKIGPPPTRMLFSLVVGILLKWDEVRVGKGNAQHRIY